MKKILMLIMISVVLSVGVVTVSASNVKFNVETWIDNITFETNPQSIIVDGRTLIPLRSVSENLRMTVDYGKDPNTNATYVRIWNSKTALTIPLEDDTYVVNDFASYIQYDGEDLITFDYTKNQYIKSKYPTTVIEGRTFVSIRLLAETFKFSNLSWDGDAKTISFGYEDYYSEVPMYDALALSWNRDELEYSRAWMNDIEIILDKQYHHLVAGSDEYNTTMEDIITRFEVRGYDVVNGYLFEPEKQPTSQYSYTPPFKVGDRVHHRSMIKGTVVAVPSFGKVTVAWEGLVFKNTSDISIQGMNRVNIYVYATTTVLDGYVFRAY